MKIVLDLTKLLEEWKITKEEYDKFSGLAKKETIWILPNILVWFGTILIFCWIASFAKSIEFIFALSVIFIGVWFFIREKLFKDWWILSSIFIILWTISASWAYFELFDFYSDWSELNYKIAIWSIALFIAAMPCFEFELVITLQLIIFLLSNHLLQLLFTELCLFWHILCQIFFLPK